jgi:hypothetical protein
MNLVRFVCVAGLIGWFLSMFGLVGAVLVTLLATAVVKFLGVVRIARLMHVGPREALPWGSLARITALAGVSAAPVLWLQQNVAWHPLLTFMAGAAVYGPVYALLSYWSVLRNRLFPVSVGRVLSDPPKSRVQKDPAYVR